jgi:iron complex transport system permease protein
MTPVTARSARRWIGLSLVMFLTAAAVLPLVGPTTLDVANLWARQEPDWSILTRLRASRTLLGLLAGGALALAGSLFQSMLRDALATPYTLGVSTGASLGAVLVIALEWHLTTGVSSIWGIWAGALAGSAVVLVVVIGAATRQRQLSVSGLLLAGIAINSISGAMILLVHGLSGMSQSYAISRWLIGSLDAIEFQTLAVYFVAVVLLGAVIIRQARQWNLLAIGDAWAATRGASVQRSLVVGYVSGSVLAAATVALTGPIGFVGLVVPHLVRARVGADDRVVMPCSFLLGGVLLAACDAVGRVVLAPAEVPAGAITAFIGGPHLVWLVRQGTTR